MKRNLSSLVIAVFLFGGVSWPSSAGGWASVDITTPMPEIVVGVPVTLEYVVRPHGLVGEELDGMDVVFRLVSVSDEVVKVTGEPTADPKVDKVIFTLPSAGTWEWTGAIVQYNGYEHRMPTITVVEEATGSGRSGPIKSKVVIITEIGFEPASITINAGESVTWVNQGALPHQVAPNFKEFATSPMLQPGEAYTLTFTDAGQVAYNCPPHPSMLGVLNVQ